MAHAHIEQPFGREIDRIALGDPRQVERRVFAAPDAPLRGIEVDRPRGRHAGRGRRTIDGPGAAKAPRFGQTAKARVESAIAGARDFERGSDDMGRSEEHTSELQSLMRNSYAVFCLKKKIQTHKL